MSRASPFIVRAPRPSRRRHADCAIERMTDGEPQMHDQSFLSALAAGDAQTTGADHA